MFWKVGFNEVFTMLNS